MCLNFFKCVVVMFIQLFWCGTLNGSVNIDCLFFSSSTTVWHKIILSVQKLMKWKTIENKEVINLSYRSSSILI